MSHHAFQRAGQHSNLFYVHKVFNVSSLRCGTSNKFQQENNCTVEGKVQNSTFQVAARARARAARVSKKSAVNSDVFGRFGMASAVQTMFSNVRR